MYTSRLLKFSYTFPRNGSAFTPTSRPSKRRLERAHLHEHRLAEVNDSVLPVGHWKQAISYTGLWFNRCFRLVKIRVGSRPTASRFRYRRVGYTERIIHIYPPSPSPRPPWWHRIQRHCSVGLLCNLAVKWRARDGCVRSWGGLLSGSSPRGMSKIVRWKEFAEFADEQQTSSSCLLRYLWRNLLKNFNFACIWMFLTA